MGILIYCLYILPALPPNLPAIEVNAPTLQEISQPKNIELNYPPSPYLVYPTPERLKDYLKVVSDTYELDYDVFLKTALCESGLNPSAIGDSGNSVGIFQINLPSHPNVSEEQALDPYWNIDWAGQHFNTPEMWTCYRLLTLK